MNIERVAGKVERTWLDCGINLTCFLQLGPVRLDQDGNFGHHDDDLYGGPYRIVHFLINCESLRSLGLYRVLGTLLSQDTG